MNDATFKKQTDAAGNEFFCPLDVVEQLDAHKDNDLSECVGKDVIGRYAGNLDVTS